MTNYDAFISYTHRSEMRLASALDDALTRFAKPWNKLRAQRIYRDTDSQALTPNLLGAVEEAMDNSEFLILMASPDSAQSNWVPKEIAHWLKSRSLDKLLIVVCAGEVVWNHESGDFDWDKTDCLPRSLQGVYEGEPLFLDLRWVGDESDLSLRNNQFKDAVARLSATLSGKSLDEMFSEEVRQFKRTTRIRNSAIVALSVLLVVALAATYKAVQARDDADRQRVVAEHQRDRAIKNNLHNEGRNDLDNNRLGHAVQVARRAREKFGADPKVRSIAWEVVRSPAAVIQERLDQGWDFARYSHDGSRLMMGFGNNSGSLDIQVVDRFGGNEASLDSVYGAYFLGDGSKLLVLQPSAPMILPLHGVDAASDDTSEFCDNFGEFRMDINDGRLAFGLDHFSGVMQPRVYDLQAQEYVPSELDLWFGQPIQVCDNNLRLFTKNGEFIKAVAAPGAESAVASPDLGRIAVQTAGDIVIMDSDGVVAAKVSGRDSVWSPDGSMLATVTYGTMFDYFEFTGAQTYQFEQRGIQMEGPRGDGPDEIEFVTGSRGEDPNENAGNGYTQIWSDEGQPLAILPGTHPFFALDGVLTVGGFEYKGTLDKHPRLWSLEARRGGGNEMRMELHGFQAVVSPDGQWIASGSYETDKTWIYDREGRFHAEVKGGLPVFDPIQPVLMTNLYGHLRDWYLPRLRSSSSKTVANILGVHTETWDRARSLSWVGECERDCDPGPGYTVELEGVRTASTSVTPGTVNEGVEVETLIDITRQAQIEGEPGEAVELISTAMRVSGCDTLSERYRDNLMLLACEKDNSWRIYDLDAGEDIDDPANHHALIWGVHEPGLEQAEFSPDGLSVITVGEDSARIWDISGGVPNPEPVNLPYGAQVQIQDISEDSSLIAMVPYNGPAQVWNFQGERLATFSLQVTGEEWQGVSFFNGSRHLVFAGIKDGGFTDFYIPWTVNLDEMFDTFNWLPPLEPSELEKLGLQ